MAANVAQRRAAKAKRRKAVVAQKRKAELLAATLPGRVRRAARTPIRHCLLTEGVFEYGLGVVILTRGATSDYLTIAAFLFDLFGLGIKDVAFRPLTGAEFEACVTTLAAPLTPCEPSYARKLLREIADWSKSIGFQPHRDFAAVEQFFGEVSADDCAVNFQFGLDGEPSHMSRRPSLAQITRRLEQLLADRYFEESTADTSS